MIYLFKNILINNICPLPIKNIILYRTKNIREYMGFNRLINLDDV